MPVIEIGNENDALERLQEFYGLSQVDAEPYAAIANFLSHSSSFENALQGVSAGIWDEYRDQRYENTPNRFTRAIIRYATKFGFINAKNIVFTGPLSDPLFLEYVGDGLLWKDSFAPAHGEFSHTFQWLAVGYHFNTWGAHRTAELYKETARKFNTVPLWSRYDQNIIKRDAGQLPLWAWLVDCFPDPDLPQVHSKDNIFSNTYRTPNKVWSHAQTGSDDFFLKYYIVHRDRKLKHAIREGSKDAYYEYEPRAVTGRSSADDGYFQKRDIRAKIQSIKSYNTRKYAEKIGWQPQGPTDDFQRFQQVATNKKAKSGQFITVLARTDTESTHRVFSRSVEHGNNNDKQLVERTFHGQPGRVPTWGN